MQRTLRNEADGYPVTTTMYPADERSLLTSTTQSASVSHLRFISQRSKGQTKMSWVGAYIALLFHHKCRP
jgi:hypothetical protein